MGGANKNEHSVQKEKGMSKDAVPIVEAKEIVIRADAVIGSIKDNFEELKKSVAQQVQKYVGKTFDDTEIVAAKKDRAALNGMINDLEERRKVLKKKFNEPLVDFETRVKDVIAVIRKPLDEIDVQIKDYEERKKQEKDEEIQSFIKESLDKEEDKVVFDVGVLFDERWLNASMSMKKVQEAIEEQISRTRQDVSTIRNLCKADKDEEILSMLLVSYKRNTNLAQVIAERSDILAQREALEKEKALAEERRKAEQEAEERMRQQKAAELPQAAEEQERFDFEPTAGVPTEEQELAATTKTDEPAKVIVRFDAVMTTDQIKALLQWFSEINAPIRKVRHAPYSEQMWNQIAPKKEN